MFSRFLVALLFLVLSLGCSLRIGEKPAQNKEIQLGDQVGCLSEIGVVLSQFLNGEIEDHKLEQFGDCVIFSVQSFENYTVGEKADEYHPDEIRHFLQQYFLKDKQISDELLNQVMNLKILILGGDKESITRTELFDFIATIRIWKKEFVALNRYMKIYNWKKSQRLQREFPAKTVDDSIEAIKLFARNVLGTFKGKGIRYNWNDFEKLMKEFREFTNWSQVHSDNGRPVEEWTHLIQTFRKVMFDQSDPTIAVEELSPFFEEMLSWMGVVIEFKYFLADKKIDREPGLTHLNSWVQDAFRLVDNATSRHVNEGIPYVDLYQLLLALDSFMEFPFELTASDFIEYFPKVFERLLAPKNDQKWVFGTDLFRREYVQQGIKIYTDWFSIQQYLAKYYPTDEGDANAETPQLDSRWFSPNAENALSGSKDVIFDLRRIISNIPPLYRKEESTAFLVEAKKSFSYQVSHDFYNLTRMNLYRVMIALVMRGYAENYNETSVMNSTMTANELQGLYLDLKPLGVKLGLLDPRSNTAGFRSFNEANLFTYVSDGVGPDAEMSFEEGMVLVGYLWSGAELGKVIYKELLKQCELGPKDTLLGDLTISRHCVQQKLGNIVRDSVHTMPGLKKYLESLNEDQLLKYADHILTAAYGTNSDDIWVEKAEINVVSMIVHYSESVMTRFNLNGNDYLERDEINSAVPLFKGFIRIMGESFCIFNMDEVRVADVFRHIVETGQIPQSQGWWKNVKLWWEFRGRRGNKWNPQFDRGHITEVFASIIARTLEESKEPIVCEK